MKATSPPSFALWVAVPFLVMVATIACAELGPVMTALPGVVSAVDAVTAAARSQGRDLAPEVLAEARALDAAHAANERARDAKLAAILAAVRRKPAPCLPVAAPVVPVATVAPLVADAGAEGGAR